MVSKENFVKIVDQARTTYKNWRNVLRLLGKGQEYIEDTVTDLVDASLEFVVAAMGDNGLPADRDKFGRLAALGQDMPLILWWAWENDWGANGMALAIDDSVWHVDTAAQLYEVLKYLHSEK